MTLPKGYVDADYLAIVAKLMQPFKQRSYEQLHLQPGQKILDLGCGPGTDTLALGHNVGPTGEVCGADYDVAMVEQANQRAAAAGLSAYVSHHQADAGALPWPDQYFDASRSERMFQHLQNPAQAFAEMLRVTRPGGWVAILDGDWSTYTIDSDEADIERRLVRFHAEHMMHNPYSGRRLHRMFKTHNLQNLSIEPWSLHLTDYTLARNIMRLDEIPQKALAAGAINTDEFKRWHASMEHAAALDGFFTSVGCVLVAGQIPHH